MGLQWDHKCLYKSDAEEIQCYRSSQCENYTARSPAGFDNRGRDPKSRNAAWEAGKCEEMNPPLEPPGVQS